MPGLGTERVNLANKDWEGWETLRTGGSGGLGGGWGRVFEGQSRPQCGSPFKLKGGGSPRSRAGAPPLGAPPLVPRPSHPAPHLLVAEDFAVVEDLNLEHLIAVDAAGHLPPEGLGREEQLWPWVEMTGRGVGRGRGTPGKIAPHISPMFHRNWKTRWKLGAGMEQ